MITILIMQTVWFFAAVAGWTSRVFELEKPMYKEAFYTQYYLPRLSQTLSIYLYVCFFEILFLTDLSGNLWAISLLIGGVLIGLEWICFVYRQQIKFLSETISFRISAILLITIVPLILSTEVGSYIEKLTGVTSLVFDDFGLLLTLALSILVWLLIAQIVFVIFSIVFIIQPTDNRKDHVSAFFGTTLIIAAMTALLVMALIEKKAIPWLIDTQFINMMYHENHNLQGDQICKNPDLSTTSLVALIPGGEVSIVTIENEQMRFKVERCVRE